MPRLAGSIRAMLLAFHGRQGAAQAMVLGRKITRLGVLIGALCMHAWAVAATDEYSVISAKEKVGSLIANIDGSSVEISL